MAAFVSDSSGFASRVCRATGVDPRLLWALLIAMSYQNDESDPENWSEMDFTEETCGRILLPVIERARCISGDPTAISEADLFRAFCEQANPAFVAFLKALADDEALELVEADLVEMRQIDPDRPGILANLTLRARTVVRTAHGLAQQQRIHPISNRLLLAAFLHEPRRLAHQMFSRRHIPVAALCEMLITSACGTAEVDGSLGKEACARIITPTIKRARELAGVSGFVTERLLFRAFCEVAEPLMKAELKKLGIDLDSLGKSLGPASGSPPKTLPPASGRCGLN